MAASLWATSLVLLSTCCCWTLASGGSSAMVGLLATSRSLNPSSRHSNNTGSSVPAKVGVTSASWSFPITSSFLPSSAPPYSTTASPSSYLKNHATSYSIPSVHAGSKNPPHKLSSANLVYTGSASSQAAYAAAAYYATSSTSTTTTTTTTPRPFAYNLPYSPIDYYFDKNTASGGKSSAFKHGTTSTSSFKQPSGGGGGYYTSDDYEDENEDAEEAHRDRYLTRNDALKADYDSAETSPPTYVKTKYGYTSLNPLLMASESSKVSSGLHRGDMDKGAADGGGSGGGSRLGDKDVGDKGYATASSDHYDYKGGFVAADYADDFGFPDLDHHLPYLHRRKHHSGKGPLALLLGLLPLGLLMAALVPSVINLPVAAVGAVGPAGRRRREAAGPAYRNPILDSIAKFGVNSLEDPHCLQRIFCEVTAQGKAPESLPVQKVFYTLSTLVNDLWAERLGLKVLFGAVKKGQCDVFRCKAAKPTKQGKRRSSKLKNKGGTLKASKE
ncbi:uncharacterized protein DDB_G0271670 [Dermacentor silvarum]|uniref:uncharacterized protein DDB_G0271670 n=1 Tax=Dermacentor silvarum TaxID=543639 RepID=UPI0021008CB1|nr:uncharacterized protein DDB_G0271670 [Dermacentor silvarum]